MQIRSAFFKVHYNCYINSVGFCNLTNRAITRGSKFKVDEAIVLFVEGLPDQLTA